MKLILSGGGSEDKSRNVDSLFTSLLLNKRILYIPIALDERKHPYENCLAWCRDSLQVYGNYEIELCSEKDLYKYSNHDLSSFGGIFIGGGNTFHLLNEFRKSGFGKPLVQLLEKTEVPVIGGSAGALIFADNIKTAIPCGDENLIGLKDLSGYGLTLGYQLWVHYEEGMQEMVSTYAHKLESSIIAMPEDSGILVSDEKIEIVGEADVRLFPEGQSIEKGGHYYTIKIS